MQNWLPLITDPIFYLVAIPAVLITGVSKGGFGGIALLAVPMLALVVSPIQAAAIMLPILLVMDATGIFAYRGRWHSKSLWILIPSAIIGIFIGALTAQFVDEQHIKLILGCIAILFTLNYWLGGRAVQKAKPPSKPWGALLGVISGYTSFVAHAGAPAFQFFMLPQKLDRRLLTGTSVVFFTVVNAMKVVPYTILGMFSAENLSTSLVLLPLAPLGVFFGFWLNRNLSNVLFYRIMYTAIFIIGVKLCWDAF